MSVIYIKKRITKDLTTFEKYKKSSQSLVFFDSEQIDNFSIDLTVGHRWAEYTGQGKVPHLYRVETSFIELKPKQSVIIETKEKIMVPHNLFGIIMPTGRLFLHNGIFCNTAKIEPGYEDKLFLLLYNSTSIVKKLNVGEKITTAIFMNTEETPATVERKFRQYPNMNKPYGWLKRFRESVWTNYMGNPYLFVFEIVKLFVIFVAGATTALVISKYIG